jgi:hypothetical protein
VNIVVRCLVFFFVFIPSIVCAEIFIPEAIKPPFEAKSVLTVSAKGDQIYLCNLKNTTYLWQLQAPDATLFDMNGQIVGKHYSGPIWEYKDGSQIVGQVLNKVDVDPKSSVSWLLVKIVSTKDRGVFSDVNFINRVNTHGGLPPLTGCDSNHLGAEKRVYYTANYIFYSTR